MVVAVADSVAGKVFHPHAAWPRADRFPEGSVTRPFDDIAYATPGIIAEQRQAAQRAEEARAASRQRALEEQSSATNDPQVRITTWERLHALTLPRAPEHALVRLIARETRLTVAEVHDEQRRRAGVLPP